MNDNKFEFSDIMSILNLASELNKTCSITVSNVFGKNTYKVDMDNWQIIVVQNKLWYNKNCAVKISDIISINICV